VDLKQPCRILIVDDEPAACHVMERALAETGYMEITAADSVAAARRILAGGEEYALVLLDLRMPGTSGFALLEDLAPRAPELVTVVVSAVTEFSAAVQALKKGAYDYVAKPFDIAGLQMAVGRALKRRQLELAEHTRYLRAAREIEARVNMLERTRSSLLRAMCLMAEFRETRTPEHLDRVSELSVALARELALRSRYAPLVDAAFLNNIAECAPLHDIGKVALPDEILLKPGPLTAEEIEIVKQHTTVGREVCAFVRQNVDLPDDGFIEMAAEVAGSHHEHWDGSGYPDGLKGVEIPLSARIVGLAESYDVCCSPTVYRPEPISPPQTAALVESLAGTHFDPVIVDAFRRCRSAFADIVTQGRP
jgi:putative two-component system response regulator